MSHENGNPSYIALTPQALQDFDLHQECSHRDVHLEYLQANQAQRIKHGLDSLGIYLEHTKHAKVCQEPVGMIPTERFQASTDHPFHTSAYKGQPAMNGNISAKPPSQEYTYGASSIVANHYGEEASYSPSRGADPVVFFPDRTYNVPVFECAQDVVDWKNDVAGIGTQFDSYAYSNHAAIPYIVDDAAFEN